MNIDILKFDNLGRGIGYYNDKIIFVPKSTPGDTVLVEITADKKKFYEGKILQITKPSKLRKEAICPYFSLCGGCDLLHISLSNSLEYKLDKINDILGHNNISYVVKKIIKSPKQYHYRNKVTLKVKDGLIGFYEASSHKIVPIDYCYLCHEEVNKVIKDLNLLAIKNGEITIRCNYKSEILLIIDSKDQVQNLDYFNNKYLMSGIVINNETALGSPFLLDKIGDYLFKISYDAFFQVNPYVCSKLMELVTQNTQNAHNILDLYCGVGSLSLVVCKNAKKVLGVEICENAIIDANINKKLNNIQNSEFICNDTKNVLNEINANYDVIILDPPRSGVSKEVLGKIIAEKIAKIIYVSCNPLTLVRDLKILLDYYKIKDFTLLDMFVNTEHVECFCILERK